MTSRSGQPAGHDPLGRTLYDIAHALESADGSDERVLHALDLLRTIVPYEHCALLHVQPGREPRLVAFPAASAVAATEDTRRLLALFRLLAQENAHAPEPHPSPPGRLAVPLIGLDEVIGVLEVRGAADAFSVSHLRALSVVAAQLAAHLTLLRARALDAERARELDQARRAAEAANRAKDEFLALVSHELKTPLNSTLAWAHGLASGELSPDARARAVDGIERGVRAQSKLIDELLDLAGIAAAASRLDLRAIEPARQIRATLDRLRVPAEARAIRIEAVLDPAVTALVVDPERFDQIISNLVASSLAHTPDGGRVDVRLERAADGARIRVTDTGTGIAPEVLPHVFESFRPQRGAGPCSRDGLGVGLAIVKKLVELHGGSVNAESGGDRAGATFTIDLPLVPEGRALAGLRILLVDDDQDFRDALRAVLEARGAEVTAVDSVAAALAALERSRPDVLLSELAMPRQSGYDLIRAIAAHHATLPAAALTRFGNPDESQRAVAAGFRMHLAKPIEIETLVTAIADLAGRPLARFARPAVTASRA